MYICPSDAITDDVAIISGVLLADSKKNLLIVVLRKPSLLDDIVKHPETCPGGSRIRQTCMLTLPDLSTYCDLELSLHSQCAHVYWKHLLTSTNFRVKNPTYAL